MTIDLNVFNVTMAIICMIILPGGGAYLALRLSQYGNIKDHEVYEEKHTKQEIRADKQDEVIKELDDRLSDVEKGMIKVFTLAESWGKRLDKIDNKLVTLCDNVSKLIGKMTS